MKANKILLKALPVVLVILLLKFGAHLLGFEVITLNAMFTGIIGADVFLLGFLLSGVLSDYKESERLPGDLAAAFSTITDELELAYRQKSPPEIRANLAAYAATAVLVRRWFYREVKTRALLAHLTELYCSMGTLEGLILPNYLARLRQEHSSIRRMVIRIHTIRDTSFIASGYVIAVTATFLLLVGLVFVRMDQFYESLFFSGMISYLVVFLIFLIKDLDNPFGYSSGSSSEDVSLKPIDDLVGDLSKWGRETAAPQAVGAGV